ncbi:metal ABC transporter solute-binding protein, Zn/Mn family [Escherichia coli]
MQTEVLLPDGASEHDYSLRPSDVKRLQNADLVVWVGPEMEAFYAKTGKQITRSEAGNDCAARRCETATDEKYSRR